MYFCDSLFQLSTVLSFGAEVGFPQTHAGHQFFIQILETTHKSIQYNMQRNHACLVDGCIHDA